MIYPDLLLNKKNWSQLTRSWEAGKLPHAILFHGPAGSGKEGHALEMAALINCNGPQDKQPCGSCSACKQTRSFQNGNVKVILPLPRGQVKSSDDPIAKSLSPPILKEYLNMLSCLQ